MSYITIYQVFLVLQEKQRWIRQNRCPQKPLCSDKKNFEVHILMSGKIMLLCVKNGRFFFFNGLFYFLPHSLKIYVKNMQLRKETENPLEQFLCLLLNLVRMVFFKLQVNWWQKKKKVYSLNCIHLASFLCYIT